MRNDESKAFNVNQFFYQNLVFETFENMTFLYLYIYKQPTKYNESDKKLFLIEEICYKIDCIKETLGYHIRVPIFDTV